MLSKAHLKTQLQALGKTAERIGLVLEGDADPEPLVLAEAAIELSRLDRKLGKLADVLSLSGTNGKRRKK